MFWPDQGVQDLFGVDHPIRRGREHGAVPQVVEAERLPVIAAVLRWAWEGATNPCPPFPRYMI